MYNFVHIPKVAGVSFKALLGFENLKVNYCGHTRAKDIQTMAFVRNPYDRLVNAFFYLISPKRKNPLDLYYQEILKQYPDFKTFVLNIAPDNLIERILHLRPMHYWICDDEGKIVIDKIFKIEDINAIDNFLEELGLDGKLSDISLNLTEYGDYRSYLEIEIVSEINKLYALDFELFGYKKL